MPSGQNDGPLALTATNNIKTAGENIEAIINNISSRFTSVLMSMQPLLYL